MKQPLELEFGSEVLRLQLPPQAEVLGLPPDTPLADPAGAVREALARPIASPSLAEIVRARRQARPHLKAVIVVSDVTRPV